MLGRRYLTAAAVYPPQSGGGILKGHSVALSPSLPTAAVADLHAQLQTGLAGQYTLERELGRGGMATVYLARDVRHKRQVALKVLDPELGAILGVARFTREIETVAQLQHPHILPVFDSGEAAGQLWYTMPYVEGESLRDRLRRESRLSVAEAVRLGQEIASALDYANCKGVIHRDIKPENILLSDGHALVADFGIARSTRAEAGQSLTATGLSLGTPAYMSPEQALGERSIDGRSDIYALGCLIYELLAGHPPYTGPTAQAVIAGHLAQPVPMLGQVRPEVPAAVEAALARAMAKSPRERFPTAGDFGETLAAPATIPLSVTGTIPTTQRTAWRRGLVLGATALALVAAGRIGLTAWQRLHEPSEPAAAKAPTTKSVAVLPLVNVGGDTAAEYFSDGLTDELTSALGKVPGLRVAARSSAFAFKGKTVDVEEVGTKLHVASVLEGSVRRAGPRLRLTAQLVNAADGLTLWSETYERKMKDVFAVQADIASAITGALRPVLGAEPPAQVASRAPANLEAYDLFLKARFHFNKETEADFRTSIGLYQQALAKDSTYAPAWAGLAQAWFWLADTYVAPHAAYPQAKAAALKAVALDSTLTDAHAALGGVLMAYDWDLRGAERELTRAIALNPSYANAYHYLGYLLTTDPERLDSALAMMRRAQALDLLSPWTTADVGWVLQLQRRYVDAIAEGHKAIALDPHSAIGFDYLGRALLIAGKPEEAMAAFQQAEGLGLSVKSGVVRALSALGRREEAQRVLVALEREAERHYVGAEKVAAAHAALGNREDAFRWLERAYRERSANMLELRVEPFWEPIRSDPRFTELTRRVGLLR